MFVLIKNCLHDFKAAHRKYLLFEIVFWLFASYLFVPFISFIYNQMLLMMGSSSLLNSDVYKIGLSYPGLIGMVIISFLSVLFLFIQFGVIIIIAQKRYFQKNVLITQALITTIKKIPKLLGFGIIQFMVIFLLLLPFIDLPISFALFDVNIPIFITNKFYTSFFTLVLYGVALVFVIYLILRWIFTLHFIIIEKKSIWNAVLCSWKLTKQNKLKILLSLFLLNLLLFVIGFSIMTLISLLPSLFDVIGSTVEHYLLTFSSYMTIIFGLFLVPINIIIITRLFYQFMQQQGGIVEDHLNTYGNSKIERVETNLVRFFTLRKTILFSVLGVYLIFNFIVNDALTESFVYLKWNVAVASHRGDLHYAPENSMSSVRSAMEKGFDVVEIDVMMTKDNVVVLSHDKNLIRMAGVSTNIRDMTYEEIMEIDIGSQFSEEFIGERVPTLNEVLLEVKKENSKLLIEIKAVESSEGIAERVVNLIELHDMEEVCSIQSFNYNILQEVRGHNPNIKIGQVMYMATGNLADLDVDFYTIHQSMLSDRFVRNAHKHRREVWVWTVNRDRNIKEVLKYKIDGIITDYPEKVQKITGVKL